VGELHSLYEPAAEIACERSHILNWGFGANTTQPPHTLAKIEGIIKLQQKTIEKINTISPDSHDANYLQLFEI
jgi:hypothetical protein